MYYYIRRFDMLEVVYNTSPNDPIWHGAIDIDSP